MNFNKLIAKGLSVGFLLNSLSILSYANTEIPNRYQTLEGEYITIDDSTEGNLEEIEIFGNTVQDKNNLEDIQSVGDLYVDENGNPILDSQGREQYEIDIISQNKNLSPNGTYYENWKPLGNSLNQYSLIENGYILDTDISRISYNKVNLKDGETYTISLDVNFLQDSEFNWIQLYWFEYNNNKAESYGPKILKSGKLKWTFTYNKNLPCLGIYFDGKYENNINENLRAEITNIQIEEGTLNSKYEPTNNHVTSILLPTQLQKVGNIADRVIYKNGSWMIEKNIYSYTITENDNVDVIGSYESVQHFHFTNLLPRIVNSTKASCINSYGLPYAYVNSDYEHVYISGAGTEGVHFSLFLDKSKASTVEEFKEYVRTNNLKILCPNNINPEFIPLMNNQQIELRSFLNTTNIFTQSENGINPTLKVTIDRLPQIAKEAVAQAESDNTNYNISLARRYINMLPESSYKDQLQNQLSNVFSFDMVLDRKTATSNLDIYIKCENILQMSLDTNSISFDDFSGIEDVEKINAVNLMINSSLPYQINAYLPTEIQNSDKTKTLDKSILNIKENSESNYQTFANTTDKIVLKDNCSAGNYLVHGVDLKLAGGIAHEKDVYKATIKLEAEQK